MTLCTRSRRTATARSPVVSARLAGANTYYVACAHSELTRDPLVASAVADILKSGETRRLNLRWGPRNRSVGRISDAALRLTHLEKVDLTTLEPDARREFMLTLSEPPPLRLRTPGTLIRSAPHRRRQCCPTHSE